MALCPLSWLLCRAGACTHARLGTHTPSPSSTVLSPFLLIQIVAPSCAHYPPICGLFCFPLFGARYPGYSLFLCDCPTLLYCQAHTRQPLERRPTRPPHAAPPLVVRVAGPCGASSSVSVSLTGVPLPRCGRCRASPLSRVPDASSPAQSPCQARGVATRPATRSFCHPPPPPHPLWPAFFRSVCSAGSSPRCCFRFLFVWFSALFASSVASRVSEALWSACVPVCACQLGCVPPLPLPSHSPFFALRSTPLPGPFRYLLDAVPRLPRASSAAV